MNNQVLALKYRPKKFEDLVGQDTISTTLSLALDTKRLSNAYLFSGLRGSGKTSTARIMAKALVCVNAPTSKACEVCDACISSNENRHLDVIEMDAASNRGIDDIKELIEHTKYKPTSAIYKVFIIDEVHMLTPQAFNALLKTLEEPPEFVKFILATTDPLKLPATILSRTQHFRFKKISPKNVLNHLTHILNLENIEFENEALEILIRSGQGSLRDTLTLLDQAIIYSKGKVSTVAVTDMMGMIDPKFMEKVFDIILNDGDTHDILNELESYEAGQVIDEMIIYLKHRMLTRDLKFDTYLFDRFFRILGDAKQLLFLNSDGGFVLILTLSKLSEATNLKTIDEIINEVQNIKVSNEVTPKVINQAVLQPVEQPTVVKTEVQSTPVLEEKVALEINESTNIETSLIENSIEVVTIDEPIVDNNILHYQNVIAKINDRSYELGQCFEKCFKFNAYENNILTIDSSASGDCKTLLYKNFAYIRSFIEDIFGANTQIEFNKIIQKEMPRLKQEAPIVQNNSYEAFENENASMIEEVELGSGCVANMGGTTAPTLAQKELNIEDILNSTMVNKAVELFQPEGQIRVKSKL